jgi:GntR family transcriptional regulator/MocR family aminotransferase
MEPIFGLGIRLPPVRSRSLLRELHRQLREAILDGRLKPGLRLPATRALAFGLGISRNTAVAAYDLLLSEGYVVGRPGAGTYVADAVPPRPPQARTPARSGATERRLGAAWRGLEEPPPGVPAGDRPYAFDFRLGLPDISQFPFEIWRRLSTRALRALAKEPADYDEPAGRLGLREAIAKHVSFARAVACRTEDVVVTAGAQQAFDVLARVLVTPGRTVVAVEDPGYPRLRKAFAAAGAAVVPVPVDGEGLVVDRIPAGAGIVCVTPSHQFPLGVALSPARRSALIDFAQTHAAVVIEDDYDGEFRFGGRPLDALQTLDRSESVFYVGTFSKSLFPALRLGFVAAPPWARHALAAAKRIADAHSPTVEQDTLAAFIAEGHLARHVRKMRKVYAERRIVLLDTIARHCGEWLTAVPSEAGLHLAARFSSRMHAEAVVANAAETGLAIQALDAYALAEPVEHGLAFGYGACRTDRIDEAMSRLARVLTGERGAPVRPS